VRCTLQAACVLKSRDGVELVRSVQAGVRCRLQALDLSIRQSPGFGSLANLSAWQFRAADRSCVRCLVYFRRAVELSGHRVHMCRVFAVDGMCGSAAWLMSANRSPSGSAQLRDIRALIPQQEEQDTGLLRASCGGWFSIVQLSYMQCG
jgi:hypothetical protein